MKLALLVVALIFASPTSAHSQAGATLPPSALIVDDTNASFAKFGPAANWFSAIDTSFNYYGGSATWTTNVTTDTINYARWPLPISATLPLTYEVFAFVPRYNSGTVNARYDVVRGGITGPVTETRAISQSKYYAEWVSLGAHAFDAGGANFVQLADSTGEPLNSRRIAFDAMAFVPQPTVTATQPVTLPTLPVHAMLPIAASATGGANPVSGAATSRYIGTLDPAQHAGMGCASGRAGEQGTLILAFGQPWAQEGAFGTIYYQSSFPFATTSAIAEASKSFLRGYWECAPPDARLNLAIGTNNYRGATLQPGTSFAHGQAWGQMVNQLQTWLQDTAPAGVAGRVTVLGGNDIEMSWNTAALTRAWVNGYASASARPFVNFGACDGCPTSGNPAQSPNNGWTVEDVWQVNGPAYVIAFPEIYLRNGINADQWYRMSLYATQQKGAKLPFGGALTQWQACQDKGACGGLTDNTPQQGWRQLQDALNANPRTAMALPPPSDITWHNGEGSTRKDTKNTKAIRASVVRRASGDGEIVEGVLPPVSAMQFVPENAWLGRTGEREVIVFAGLVRDPVTGGDDTTSRGGVAVFEMDAASGFVLSPAPLDAQALRVVSAQGAVLMLSDGVMTMTLDVTTGEWR